jgi:hypothetical protein
MVGTQSLKKGPPVGYWRKDRVLQHIKALQAKVDSESCTEGEAAVAADLISKLMTQYGFQPDDLETRDPVTTETYFFKGKKVGSVSFLMEGIARLFNCKVWETHEGGTRGNKVRLARSKKNPHKFRTVRSGGTAGEAMIQFFGRETDTACCMYLVHLFHNVMEIEWRRFQQTGAYDASTLHGRTLRKSFEMGMVGRLQERLDAMILERNRTVDAGTGRTGQEVMVTRNAEIEDAFEKTGHKLSSRNHDMTAQDKRAFHEGVKAGDRVNITTGVAGSTVLRIAA